ncbi:MAG TPA: cytochrome c maturation protein CcmE [Gammaproteobacteria bacterium]|nr:cytochrome c maturation protein CcmE [Gammaproteobacteria bacterium]
MLKLNKQHKQRFYYLAFFMLTLSLGTGLILYALKQNINLFFTPTEALQSHFEVRQHFRLGGQVKPGSLAREKGGLRVHFILTDLKADIFVSYTGVLPDLFREGKGAIATGYWGELDKKEFIATEILAKHDENYLPRVVYEAMKKH